MALDPNFATNGYVYLAYLYEQGGDPADSHSIGTIRFAPDGSMFIGTGDGAWYDDVDTAALRAQNLNSLSGKILRINSDGTAPQDNPRRGLLSNRTMSGSGIFARILRFSLIPFPS